MNTNSKQRLAALFAAFAMMQLFAGHQETLGAAPGLQTEVGVLEHRIGIAKAKAAIASARIQRLELLIAVSHRKQDDLEWRLDEARSQVEREGSANSIRSRNAKRLKQLEHAAAIELEALARHRKRLLRQRARAQADAAIESRRGTRMEIVKLSVLASCRLAETPAPECGDTADTDSPRETK